MTIRVTQCPKCQTSFRVTEAQLKIANGAVRCGSCLHIFNAPDHWIGAEDFNPEPVAPSPPPARKTAPPSPQRTPADDEDASPKKRPSFMTLDDEPEPAFNKNIEKIEDTIEQSALNEIFDEDIFADELEELIGDRDETSAGDSPVADESEEAPEEEDFSALIEEKSLIEEQHLIDDGDLLISDDMDIAEDHDDNTHHYSNTRQSSLISTVDENTPLSGNDDSDEENPDTGEFSDTFLDIDSWEPEAKRVFKDLDDLGEEAAADEDAWTKKLLDEDEDKPASAKTNLPPRSRRQEPEEISIDDPTEEIEEEPKDQFQDIFESMEESSDPYRLDPELLDILNERGLNEQALSEQESNQHDQREESDAIVEETFILTDEPLSAGERIGHEKRFLIAGIEPEPVVFATGIDRNRWARRGWRAAIVLAVLLLGFQYVAFNFDRLARDNRYRDTLATVCGIVVCTLPERDDIRLIRSSNLMVRSHPKVANALVVDAIITNSADFTQPFPDMELQFANLAGNIVAGRRFTAEEYLSGELAGMTLMPIRQPVHIALEILDPGQDAVNYQLRFYTKQSR